MAIAALLYAIIGLVAGAIGLLVATSAPLQIRPAAEGTIVTSQLQLMRVLPAKYPPWRAV
jgi:hypothetical protein